MAISDRGGVTVNTNNLERLIKRLRVLERKEIRWGFFPTARYGPENDNMYVATIAKLQETGREATADVRQIPPRPFFTKNTDRVKNRGDTHGATLVRLLGVAVGVVMRGRADTAPMEQVANHLKGSLEDEIIVFDTPPNAPYTIIKKKSSDPLIDTGKMLESVEWRILRKRDPSKAKQVP